ncbi:hypothetical protein [Cryptosporangium sp. NPDC051539]
MLDLENIEEVNLTDLPDALAGEVTDAEAQVAGELQWNGFGSFI